MTMSAKKQGKNAGKQGKRAEKQGKAKSSLKVKTKIKAGATADG
jgi:hypothetical protein